MTAQRLCKKAVLGFLTLALVGATHNQANAATRISFGALIPAQPYNAVETAGSAANCSIPDSSARITERYQALSAKPIADLTGSTTVRILLDLDSIGNVLQARIATSSGNTPLDQVAILAARGSKYAPEVRNCNSFKRSYYLDVAIGE